MVLVVAWFCECGSSVRMSFCAAQRRVWADAGVSASTAAMVAVATAAVVAAVARASRAFRLAGAGKAVIAGAPCRGFNPG